MCRPHLRNGCPFHSQILDNSYPIAIVEEIPLIVAHFHIRLFIKIVWTGIMCAVEYHTLVGVSADDPGILAKYNMT